MAKGRHTERNAFRLDVGSHSNLQLTGIELESINLHSEDTWIEKVELQSIQYSIHDSKNDESRFSVRETESWFSVRETESWFSVRETESWFSVRETESWFSVRETESWFSVRETESWFSVRETESWFSVRENESRFSVHKTENESQFTKWYPCTTVKIIPHKSPTAPTAVVTLVILTDKPSKCLHTNLDAYKSEVEKNKNINQKVFAYGINASKVM